MPEEPLRVVEERESWLLIARGDRFAVVERRGGRIYGLETAHRRGEADTPAGMAAAVGADGWRSETEARATFAGLVARGRELARRML
ncbi:MAG TPA: hypothetical protein VFO41_08900 [Alphaproteobacteria bacterium]|nr:hypothetical protein [Alphaproteobacteria bacterium]